MRLVVCDTGPLLHLNEVGYCDLLSSCGRILIPPAIVSEMNLHVRDWSADKPVWISITSLDSSHADKALAWSSAEVLHGGEADSIALALQASCDWYLTDDAAARLFASSLGLEVHGTLGVVLWAAASGALGRSEATGLLNQLASVSSLWISPRVLAEALAALDEIFPG